MESKQEWGRHRTLSRGAGELLKEREGKDCEWGFQVGGRAGMRD